MLPEINVLLKVFKSPRHARKGDFVVEVTDFSDGKKEMRPVGQIGK